MSPKRNNEVAQTSLRETLPKDLKSGLVVALVALPLCLGIALASSPPDSKGTLLEVPLMSGLIAGIIGGLIISWISGSKTSVSGPAAGLTAVVITQISNLGSFQAFLTAVVIAGVLQLILGALRAGALANYFPESVIKGLLAAIGVILILKQIPHLFGHDPDWVGDMSFQQIDGQNTFSELIATWFDIQPAVALIGISSVALLWIWPHTALKRLPIPAPLFIVLGAAGVSVGMRSLGGIWVIDSSHLVEVPVKDSFVELMGTLPHPDFSVATQLNVWVAAITICIVASLETLLNLEAVDKIDPQQRVSPPNRELFAQGIGNITSGLLGGLPVTSVIVRSSVNVSTGGQTRAAAFIHGLILVLALALFPDALNQIPLACLAAILLVTGFKLASPQLFMNMWRAGKSTFLTFLSTVLAIVFTDLLIGIGVGLVVAFVSRHLSRYLAERESTREVE